MLRKAKESPLLRTTAVPQHRMKVVNMERVAVLHPRQQPVWPLDFVYKVTGWSNCVKQQRFGVRDAMLGPGLDYLQLAAARAATLYAVCAGLMMIPLPARQYARERIPYAPAYYNQAACATHAIVILMVGGARSVVRGATSTHATRAFEAPRRPLGMMIWDEEPCLRKITRPWSRLYLRLRVAAHPHRDPSSSLRRRYSLLARHRL